MFVAHLFSGSDNGCGANTLALLTGENPDSLPPRDDWGSRFMLRFLAQRGFVIAKLTAQNLTNRSELAYPIRNRHVILALIRLVKNEASWVVIHNGILYHNFEVSTFRPYELINHPAVSSYLLSHPKWGVSKMGMHVLEAKREAKRQMLQLRRPVGKA